MRQKMQLLFLGPGSTVDEAYWYSKDDLVLLGTQGPEENKGISAVIWWYSLPEKTFYFYKAKNDQGLAKTMLRLGEERLKNLPLK